MGYCPRFLKVWPTFDKARPGEMLSVIGNSIELILRCHSLIIINSRVRVSSVLNVILAVASAPPSIRLSIVSPHLGSGCFSPSGNNSVRTRYHKQHDSLAAPGKCFALESLPQTTE